jgi:Flp pilus assembly protein CpaB
MRPAWMLCLCLACGSGCVETAPEPASRAVEPDGPAGLVETALPRDGGPQVARETLSQRVRKRGRAVSLQVVGVELLRQGDHVDLLTSVVDPRAAQLVTVTLVQNCVLLGVGEGRVTALLLPEEAEVASLAASAGRLHASLRHPEDSGGLEERLRTSVENILTGERARAFVRTRQARLQGASPSTQRHPLHGLRGLLLELAGGRLAVPGDRLDVIVVLQEPRQAQPVSLTVAEDVWVLAGGEGGGSPDVRALQVLPEEAELLTAAAGLGSLSAALRNPEDGALGEERSRATLDTVLTGERPQAVKRPRVPQPVRLIPAPGGGVAPPPAGEGDAPR